MLCLHYMFISLFAMNQIYVCLCCTKVLGIILIKMVVSAVYSIDFLFFEVKNQFLELCTSHDFLALKHVLKKTHTLATPTEARSIGLNMTDLTCEREKL